MAFSKNRPVWDLIATALPVTLLINAIAFPISYFIAIPTGILASVRRGGWFDVGSGLAFLSLYSIPTVLAGVFAIGFLANKQYLGLFPVSGLHASGSESFTFLPYFDDAGTWHEGWLLDTLWHIALPILCLVYTSFAVLSKQTRAAMLAGSVVIERIFTIPGMGSLILEAIDLRDREIILANTFMIACVNLLALLLADILYAVADPRVSYE